MEKYRVYYYTMLSDEQQAYLANCQFGFNRYQCFTSLLRQAVRQETTYKKKGFQTLLQKGQVAASEVELAQQWKCSRKTVSRFIGALNRLGMVSTETNNRTSIHTLICLSAWIVDGQWIRNPLYVRPNDKVLSQKQEAVAANTDNLAYLGTQLKDDGST